MNHTSSFQPPLEIDYPLSSGHEYIDPSRSFWAHPSLTPGSVADQVRRDGTAPGHSVHPLVFPASHGIRYTAPAGRSLIPNRGSVSSSPSSAASAFPFSSPYTNGFHGSYDSSVTFPATGPSNYTSAATFSPYAMSEPRPRIPSLHPASGMPPPSRSPAAHDNITYSSTREAYKTSTPHTNRHTLSPRSLAEPLTRLPQSPGLPSSRSTASRGIAMTSSGTILGNQSLQIDPATQLKFGTTNEGPPLEETTIIHQISTSDGQKVRPEITARIDKGFFLAEQDWTCYRRNYFSVACAYSLQPSLLTVPLFLDRGTSTSAATENIRAFAMSISAVVDGAGGKPVDLVQHTPKRDKGPQGRPDRVKLLPQTAGSVGLFSGGAAASNSLSSSSQIPGQQDYDSSFSPQNTQQQTIANFERIQFKSATANNGKRRAAQQYYHLVVELFADVGNSIGSTGSDARWVKIATRISAPMVVRGRSPGHYQDDRRASSSSTGPGGASGGGDKSGGHLSSSSGGPSSGTRSMGNPMSQFGGSSNTSSNGGGYHSRSSLSHSLCSSRYDSHSHTSSSNSSSISSSLEHPGDSMPSSEDVDHFASYQYFPQPVFDMQPNNYRLPSFNTPPLKQEVGHSFPATPMESFRKHDRCYEAEEPRKVFKEEYPGGGGMQLPGLGHSWHNGAASHRKTNMLGGSCGRFQASVATSSTFPDLPAL